MNRLLLAALCITAAQFLAAAPQAAEPTWIPLFNGKDLSGWTPKIAGHPVGHNFANTFRVEDGILKVAYDGYESFDGQFGHLYSNLPYSHYRLRLEYRFEGKVMPDAPWYTNLNSGVMLHAQSPLSQRLDQGFPASIEMQFLADEGKGPRCTGNVVTPGTHIEIHGKLVTDHIVESGAPTFPADEWVRMEVEVRGNDEITFFVNGTEYLRFQRPQLDPADPDSQRLLAAGADPLLSFGHIALQAEAQPIWFRAIEILPLPAAE